MTSFFMDPSTRRFSAIRSIILVTTAIYVLVFLLPSIGSIIIKFGGLIPQTVVPGGQVWRLLTYALLHDPHSIFHIFFNMMGLWMFGREIEMLWGSGRFLCFYICTALFAGAFSLLTILFTPAGTIVNIIGASGALMALLVVYAFYFPNRQLLFFFVIPMRVRTAVIVFAVISVLGTRSSAGGVSHITHLGGLIAGFIWIKWGTQIGTFFMDTIPSLFHRPKQTARTYPFRRPDQQRESKDLKDLHVDEVDRVLKKISARGMRSLTAQERAILQEASINGSK